MQHIETDHFAQSRVIVVVSLAQAAFCFSRTISLPNIDEGTEISDRVDMHHASYQSAFSSTHHLEISSSTRRHSDFTRWRSYTPYFTLTSSPSLGK